MICYSSWSNSNGNIPAQCAQSPQFQPCSMRKIRRLEPWLSGYEHALCFQKSQVQFSAPTSDGLQPPVSPLPGESVTSGFLVDFHS